MHHNIGDSNISIIGFEKQCWPLIKLNLGQGEEYTSDVNQERKKTETSRLNINRKDLNYVYSNHNQI